MPTKTLNEFVVAAHFQAPINATILDFASWASAFPEFPVARQLEPGGRLDLPPPAAGVEFISAGVMPRLMLTNDEGETVQFQNDRFAYGWTRRVPAGEPADYPGFQAMLEKFRLANDRFSSWHKERFGVPPSPVRLVELAYINFVPLERDGQRRRLSDIFKLVTPGIRKVNGFNTVWVEALRPEPDAPRVTAQVGLAKAPPDIDVLAFNFTGLAKVSPEAPMIDMIVALHERITDMYQATMSAEL